VEKATTCLKCGSPVARSPRGRPKTYCGPVCRRLTEYSIRRLTRRLTDLENRASHLRHEARPTTAAEKRSTLELVAGSAQGRQREDGVCWWRGCILSPLIRSATARGLRRPSGWRRGQTPDSYHAGVVLEAAPGVWGHARAENQDGAAKARSGQLRRLGHRCRLTSRSALSWSCPA
jgi:hypothetical protein